MNLGILAMTDSTRPPLSQSAEDLRRALVDSAALARLAKAWEARVSPAGCLVGRRGAGPWKVKA